MASQCRLILIAISALLAAAVAEHPRGVQAAAPPGYRIVVNPQNAAVSVDRKFISDAFLKKVTRWPDGEPIRPVDQQPESPTRARFSDEVVKRSVSAVKSYWQQLVFSGREIPPPELDSDEEVIRYLLRFPGAVGYVSGAASLDRVKVVTVK